MRHLIAKYADKRGCFKCHGPVERLGETYHSDKDDEFYFEPRSVVARSLPEGRIPEFEPERFTVHEWQTIKTLETPAGTRTKPEQHVQYEYLVDFLCPSCGVMQWRDTEAYTGPTHDWMLSQEAGQVRQADSKRTSTMTPVSDVARKEIPF